MGPKKGDNFNKGRRPSQPAIISIEDQGYYNLIFNFYSSIFKILSRKSAM